jgi:GNAT superfamily N-acetyltransferase
MPFQIRLATPDDVPAMLHISSRTWGGEDYLAEVMDEWLADPNGYYYVAFDQDILVGMSRLTQLGVGEWWLEGIRVEPERYSQGIGRALHIYCIEQAHQLNGEHDGLLRLVTSSQNHAIHKLCMETEFERTGAFTFYRANTTDRHADQFRQLTLDDIPITLKYLQQSAFFSASSHSFELEPFKYFLLTEDRLRAEIETGVVYGWTSPQLPSGLLHGIVIVDLMEAAELRKVPGSIPMLPLTYLDAAEGQLAVMASAVRGLAGSLGFRKVQGRFLSLSERLVALEQAGFRRRGEDKLYLFSRKI